MKYNSQKRLVLFLFIFFSLSSLSSLSSAYATVKGTSHRFSHSTHPCKADVEKLCHNVQNGSGRIMKCLKDHRDELSPECKVKFEEKRRQIQKRWLDCKKDKEKFCQDIKKGDGGGQDNHFSQSIVECLHEHRSELSDKCQEIFIQREKRAQN